MANAEFRIHAELNDFLPPGRRGQAFPVALDRRTSVKDMTEALGVPHKEVEAILANDEPVDFSNILQDGEWIRVYPVSAASDLSSTLELRE